MEQSKHSTAEESEAPYFSLHQYHLYLHRSPWSHMLLTIYKYLILPKNSLICQMFQAFRVSFVFIPFLLSCLLKVVNTSVNQIDENSNKKQATEPDVDSELRVVFSLSVWLIFFILLCSNAAYRHEFQITVNTINL